MPNSVTIRNVGPDDLDWIYSLNRELETELSVLGRGQLAQLLDLATFARVVAPEGAFLVALGEEIDYGSENFLWFRERQHRFLYVDRVAVAAAKRRRGFARRLYLDLFDRARRAGYQVVCAEVNSDPPNLGSEQFHDSLGFRLVGERQLSRARKRVRYFVRELSAEDLSPPAPPR